MNIMAFDQVASVRDSSVLIQVLNEQRNAFIAEGYCTEKTRLDRLSRLVELLKNNKRRVYDAINADFGMRCLEQTYLTDINATLDSFLHAKKHVKAWMRAERRKPQFPLGLLGVRTRIEYQPLGVIGCIAPWNFPVQLALQPLAGIIAAGNRAMIKPSELTPVTSGLLSTLFAEYFSRDEIHIATGGVDVAEFFSSLPFDHLLFTGSHSVAKKIMLAAAENLVPLTLELGGKSPVVIGRSANINEAAVSIMSAKTMNAGQICLAPDYAFVPEESVESFVQACQSATQKMYPTLLNNKDYTSIINDRHANRLHHYVAEAVASSARVVSLDHNNECQASSVSNRFPPTLIIDPAEYLTVMRDEVFGPILLVKPYKDIADVIRYINERPHPLALYYFGRDPQEQSSVLKKTRSGGVTINDAMLHASQDNLPFGGVGASGMGAYHGVDGFRRFSHARAIFQQSTLVAKMMKSFRPPFNSH